MTALTALMLRDMRLAVRVGGGALMGVLFFLIVVTIVPFAIGPDAALLRQIGPAILWLGALLASLLALDRLFAADHEDGSLDLLLMGETPLELAVLAKALAHWITTGLPLVVAVPVLALFLGLEAWTMGAVALTLLVGTPALTFIGTVGAALAAGPDAVLLDNMTPDQLRDAVELTDKGAVTEASGRVTLDTVSRIAASGVDLISVGWITHSAPSLDLGLDVHDGPAAA